MLFDAGGTVAVENIDRALLDPMSTASPSHSAYQNQPDTKSADSEGELTLNFPLKVKGLEVGRVEKRGAEFPQLTSPVCVIGSDDQSLSWLVSYYDQLVKLGARCLLVQVKDQKQLARVAKFSKDIPVMPDLTGISVQLFKLKHYPVLISKKWIEQ